MDTIYTAEKLINQAYDNLSSTDNHSNHDELIDEAKKLLPEIINDLTNGKLRIAEYHNGDWQVNQWLKKAILLFFKLTPSKVIKSNYGNFFDKIPAKYHDYQATEFAQQQIRVAPQASVRWGSYVANNCVIMPSFINIGAYIDQGSMIDTWATVGSCAQIGRNVHISGGVGIGGVLEPLGNNPTIIEDNCFIGARSEIVEGVIVGANSVIGMGVFLGQSTKIYNRETDAVSYGYIPPGSVVVAGNLPDDNGKYSLYCAVIVKTVDQKTRNKTQINQLLRS